MKNLSSMQMPEPPLIDTLPSLSQDGTIFVKNTSKMPNKHTNSGIGEIVMPKNLSKQMVNLAPAY